ncbi:L,D-transpeptidase family protein [Streptomyces sp. NPDC005533]|uniref:L,D-transpeptidase family protein n=1 Tax=Streptomyces sp. NPDC005533 TaxID=3364723 RepID=UPI0036A4F676
MKYFLWVVPLVAAVFLLAPQTAFAMQPALSASAKVSTAPPGLAKHLETGAARPAPVSVRDIKTGDEGDDVTAVQKMLTKLHYYHGEISGIYDDEMIPAVWTFQKVQGLEIGETINAAMLQALQNPKEPTPLLPNGDDNRVEVDLSAQLMQVYKDGELAILTHISSGSGRYYCSEGRCRYATTPTGDYEVYRIVEGWETVPTGYMYRPLYFYGGFALHGSSTVPLEPDSHGCIRIPMPLADLVSDTVEIGWPVHLRRP